MYPRRASDLSEAPTADLQSDLGNLDPALLQNKHHELLDRLAVDPGLQAQIRAYCMQHSPEALVELDGYPGATNRQQPTTTTVPENQDQMVKDAVDDYQML
ncbi:hypothetical protein ACHAPT_013047 [Fusarium lateritium]